jgi:hypothetical protein
MSLNIGKLQVPSMLRLFKMMTTKRFLLWTNFNQQSFLNHIQREKRAGLS